MGFEYKKDTQKWHKARQQHYNENIGKTFLIRDVRWEPGNQHIGKIGKCVEAYISYSNSDVRYITLDAAPGVAYTLKELKEIE